MIYVLIFYFFRNKFGKICLFFSIATVVAVVVITLFSIINGNAHILNLDWKWYDKLYLLGFVLPLGLIYFYNGEKGGNRFSSTFFYVYYPSHLLVLSIAFSTMTDIRSIFIIVQGTSMLLIAVLLAMAAVQSKRSSNASVIATLIFGLLFMVGFFGEIINPTYETIKEVVKIEYVADCGFLICFTWFVADFLRMKVPVTIYIIEGWNINENLDETDIIESDCFTDKKSAECELENMKQKYSRCEWALNKYAIDECEWTDGFVRM